MQNKFRVFISYGFEEIQLAKREILDSLIIRNIKFVYPDEIEIGAKNPTTILNTLFGEVDYYLGLLSPTIYEPLVQSGKTVLESEYEAAVLNSTRRTFFACSRIDQEVFDIPSENQLLKFITFRRTIWSSEKVVLFDSSEELIFQVIKILRNYSTYGNNLYEWGRNRYVGFEPSFISSNDRPFSGRNNEISKLRTWAYSESMHPAIVTGDPGAGKTALAAAFLGEAWKTKNCGFNILWWGCSATPSLSGFLTDFLKYEIESPPPIAPSFEEMMDLFFRELETRPHLIAIDGLEVLLPAYSPGIATSSILMETHSLRVFDDISLSRFFDRIFTVRKSKVLITTRIEPRGWSAKEESECLRISLDPPSEKTSMEILSGFGLEVSDPVLSRLAKYAGNNPLVLRILAGQFIEGGFIGTPSLNEPSLQLLIRQIGKSLDKANNKDRAVLNYLIERPRETIYFADLYYSLVEHERTFATPSLLDVSLTKLEDLGLIVWNQLTNTYSAYPILHLTRESINSV